MARYQTHMGHRLCPACGSTAGRCLGQKNDFHMANSGLQYTLHAVAAGGIDRLTHGGN